MNKQIEVIPTAQFGIGQQVQVPGNIPGIVQARYFLLAQQRWIYHCRMIGGDFPSQWLPEDKLSDAEDSPRLHLKIELVPLSCWYQNLRTAMKRSDWNALRATALAASNNRCAICGANGRLHCHELWDYHDDEWTQTLQGFQAICEWCHHVKHIGLAADLARLGKLDYQQVVDHFLQVNGCDLATFQRHREEANALWQERSAHEWTTDLGVWQDLVKKS